MRVCTLHTLSNSTNNSLSTLHFQCAIYFNFVDPPHALFNIGLREASKGSVSHNASSGHAYTSTFETSKRLLLELRSLR